MFDGKLTSIFYRPFSAFGMINEAVGPDAFFSQGSPLCIMTDNADPLRNALRNVWPNAKLFLCHFHILQQVSTMYISVFYALSS